jgi:hypothetical protein
MLTSRGVFEDPGTIGGVAGATPLPQATSSDTTRTSPSDRTAGV